MKAQVETLELLGNNIANASTTGYKRDNEFQRLFVTERAQAAFLEEDPALMPVVEGSKVDYQQGPLLPTEAALDVALMGPGFLVVGSPDAPFYTRSGHLSMSADGRLTTPEGRAVLDTEDREIVLPAGARIDIGPRGMVLVDDLPVAQLAIVEFDGAPPLRKAGTNAFQAAASGLARPASETTVRQGYLEGSNVDAPLSAVRLMLATRNFQMLRQAASLIGDEMNGRAIDELGGFGR